jgi:signal transduction histidine kinase
VKNEGIPIGTLCVGYKNDYQVSDEEMRIIGIISSAIGNEDNRRFRNEALKANETKLKDLNATKDRFFSIIAHDLKGPFNGIIGLSEILRAEARNLDIATIVEYSEMMHTSANQACRLLNNLLNWARLQEGKISFTPIPNVLHNVVGEVILLFIDIAEHKKITLVNQVPTQLIVEADTEMLKTILRNLISNAMKFTNRNGKVRISAITLDTSLEIIIADNGQGIKEKNLSKLFKADNTFSTLGTENERGTGLGLILCREFVEKHGGSISVKSKPGKGSQFKFTLPFNSNSLKNEK